MHSYYVDHKVYRFNVIVAWWQTLFFLLSLFWEQIVDAKHIVHGMKSLTWCSVPVHHLYQKFHLLFQWAQNPISMSVQILFFGTINFSMYTYVYIQGVSFKTLFNYYRLFHYNHLSDTATPKTHSFSGWIYLLTKIHKI